MRTVDELLDDEPAWPAVDELVSGSRRHVEVLPIAPDAGRACLHRLQVTNRSVLGALALECGGLVVDRWLRILGGGAPGLPSLAEANGLDGAADGTAPPALVVAIDAVAGRFAVNGGGLVGEFGEVCYFAPDTLSWEPLGMGHGAFVEWALGDGLDPFYEDLRWPNWQELVTGVALDQAVASFPPAFTEEGRHEELITRAVVPWTEHASFLDQMAVELAGYEDGRTVRLTLADEPAPD